MGDGKGATTTFVSELPHIRASLRAWVDNHPVAARETDRTAGEFNSPALSTVIPPILMARRSSKWRTRWRRDGALPPRGPPGRSGARPDKWVDDASGPPTADDDAETLGVTVGSLWIDTANHRVWICMDASAGAAVWAELTWGGAEDATQLDYDNAISGLAATDVQAAIEETGGRHRHHRAVTGLGR